MSQRSLNISDCELVGSVIKFAFPQMSHEFSFNAYSLFVRGVVRNYRQMLALSFQFLLFIMLVKFAFIFS